LPDTVGRRENEADAEGRDEQELRPAMFPGLVIPLARLWKPRTPGE
jgi:hypothetical protein